MRETRIFKALDDFFPLYFQKDPGIAPLLLQSAHPQGIWVSMDQQSEKNFTSYYVWLLLEGGRISGIVNEQ